VKNRARLTGGAVGALQALFPCMTSPA